MVAYAIKSNGGFVWATKNYDGETESKLVVFGLGSENFDHMRLISEGRRIDIINELGKQIPTLHVYLKHLLETNQGNKDAEKLLTLLQKGLMEIEYEMQTIEI